MYEKYSLNRLANINKTLKFSYKWNHEHTHRISRFVNFTEKLFFQTLWMDCTHNLFVLYFFLSSFIKGRRFPKRYGNYSLNRTLKIIFGNKNKKNKRQKTKNINNKKKHKTMSNQSYIIDF